MNTEQGQYHTTHSEQNRSQHHNTQDFDMTQDCWPPVGNGGTLPSPTTASPIGRVKRHLTATSGTAEWPLAETVNDLITTSEAPSSQRVKWPAINTADLSLQNETIRPMDLPPLTESEDHQSSTIESNYNGKRWKVGDTAPNRDAPYQ